MPKAKSVPNKAIKKLDTVQAKTLDIHPNHNYLIILDKKDAGTKGDLKELNTAIQELFEDARVLAIFVSDLNAVKIAEYFKDEGGAE